MHMTSTSCNHWLLSCCYKGCVPKSWRWQRWRRAVAGRWVNLGRGGEIRCGAACEVQKGLGVGGSLIWSAWKFVAFRYDTNSNTENLPSLRCIVIISLAIPRTSEYLEISLTILSWSINFETRTRSIKIIIILKAQAIVTLPRLGQPGSTTATDNWPRLDFWTRNKEGGQYVLRTRLQIIKE